MTGSEPVRQGSPGVWVSEAIASACWQPSEELQACAYAGFDFCTKNPWPRLGSGGLEVAEACLLRPFGGETSMFVRSNSFVNSRQWDAMVSEKQVCISTAHAFVS